VDSGKLLKVLEGNEGTIWSVNFSPNGELIAAGSNDDKVIVWNVNTGEIKYEFLDAVRDIWEVVFHPTGDYLAASGSDNAIRIYNVETGKLIKTILGHSKVPLAMDFSPSGALLASGGDDKTVKIWDTKTWKLLHTLQGDNEAIHSVVFIGNDKVLAGGTDKKMLGELLEYHLGFAGYTKPIVATLYDINNETILQTITAHTDDVGLGMDVSSDRKLIATPSKDKTVKIWKVN
jgi:WD40 repeat protein